MPRPLTIISIPMPSLSFANIERLILTPLMNYPSSELRQRQPVHPITSNVSASDRLLDQDVDSPPRGRGRLRYRSWWYPYYVARATFRTSYVNVLLVFVPIGIAAAAAGCADAAIFCLNFLAIIPLASLIAFSTKELSSSIGRVFGGLLKAVLRNAAETIVGIIAVSRGQIHIVQASLVGSILFDSLLVLGSSCFFAGYGRVSAKFNKTLTNIMSSLMMVASVIMIVPTAMSSTTPPSDTTEERTEHDVLILSHGIAIILCILFAIFLYFQLKTHACLFLDPPHDERAASEERDHSDIIEVERGPLLGPWTSGCILVISTFCVIVCASYLVDSIDGLSEAINVRTTFIGLVFIPAACSAARCATIVTASRNYRMDFVMRKIIGSVLQIALFTTPLLILLGWILGEPMTLSFDVFEAAVLFLAVMMNYLIQNGKTNYFEGVMLMGTYIIIVVAFFVRPAPTGKAIIPRY